MMNSQKKQKAAIAVTAVLSVTAILSPTALYAVEDNQNIQITLSKQMEGKKLIQGIPSEKNNFLSNVKKINGQTDIQIMNSEAAKSLMSNSNNAITSAGEAENAINDIIEYYGLSNETTEQE